MAAPIRSRLDIRGFETTQADQHAPGRRDSCRLYLPRTKTSDTPRQLKQKVRGNPMLTLHHLNDSRSQRILWLLEELGTPYEIKHYQRDATTRLAPPELKAVHPLGKSPVITDGDITIAESGAIVDYIVRKHGGGRLAVAGSGPEAEKYKEWLHYAEGSAMLPLMLNMYVTRLGDAGQPLHARIQSEMANHLSYVEGSLAGRDWLMGSEITGADIQM